MILLKNIAKYIIRSLARIAFDRSPRYDQISGVIHVVVIRWDAKLGDSVVSSFFYREIKKLKNYSVTVLTVENLAALHQNEFNADQVIVTSEHPKIQELLTLKDQLGRVDIVLHPVGKIPPREIFFLWLLKPKQVYSLDDALRIVNRKMGVSTHGMLFVEKYSWVLEQLGVENIKQNYIVPVLSSDIQDSKPAIKIDFLFNPYASRDDKSLSTEKSLELLRCLSDAYPNYSIGILNSVRTKQQATTLAKESGRNNIFSLDCSNTPQKVAAEIKLAKIVISVDTAIVHMAVGLRKRLVAIYPYIGARHNPWLPPQSAITSLIYSYQDVSRYERYGTKDMNQFDTRDILLAVANFFENELHSVVRIKARLISGMGVATRTLARQLPLISERFPEVSSCWPGTLNLELETELEVVWPDHKTPPLAWTPSGIRTEVFELVRIQLELPNKKFPVPAWLYIAHDSPHRKNFIVHEVIAQKLDISEISYCYITIPANSVRLGDQVGLLPASNSELDSYL